MRTWRSARSSSLRCRLGLCAQGDRRLHLGAADASGRVRACPRGNSRLAGGIRRVRALDFAHRHVAAAHRQGGDGNGVELELEDRVFLMFGSANRDEAHFANADQFDLTRDTSKSIAFGAGPHFCAGAAASRAMIADVALPSVFARLKGLRLEDSEPVRVTGWAFRGLQNLPVVWAP